MTQEIPRDPPELGVFQEVEQREERLQRLEDLVLKLDKERRRLQEEAPFFAGGGTDGCCMISFDMFWYDVINTYLYIYMCVCVICVEKMYCLYIYIYIHMIQMDATMFPLFGMFQCCKRLVLT